MQTRIRALLATSAVIVLAFLAMSCSDDSDAESDDEVAAPTQVLQEDTTPAPGLPDLTTDAPPGTTASSGGAEVEMGIGTYCWTTLCVDKIGPITRGTLTIASGDEVVVQVPSSAPALNEVSAEAFPATNPQEVEGGETAWQPDFSHDGTLEPERDRDQILIVPELEPGTYVLVVGMYFETGDVQYGVVLEVE